MSSSVPWSTHLANSRPGSCHKFSQLQRFFLESQFWVLWNRLWKMLPLSPVVLQVRGLQQARLKTSSETGLEFAAKKSKKILKKNARSNRIAKSKAEDIFWNRVRVCCKKSKKVLKKMHEVTGLQQTRQTTSSETSSINISTFQHFPPAHLRPSCNLTTEAVKLQWPPRGQEFTLWIHVNVLIW